jgi:predicted AlkP superfamily phosphohydrolase/phosphomutase
MLLDSLMRHEIMPSLKRFMEGGARASLMSTPCPLTPPAWTSMLTGRGPGQHGIFDFTLAQEVERNRFTARMTTARDVKSETLWSMAGRQGKTSGVLNFPVTFLSRPFNGYLVPGYVTPRVIRTCVHPREFWNDIKDLPGFNVKDIAWDMDVGLAPLDSQRMEPDKLMNWVDYLKRKEKGWFAVARHLLEKTSCDLLVMVFEGVDRLQHMTWDLLDPEIPIDSLSSEERALRDYCLDYYRDLDSLLGQLVAIAGRDARVFIASDHGFGSTREIFYVNAWLAKHGYLRWNETIDHDNEGLLTTQNLRQFYEGIDWERTIAYASTATSNGVYLRVAKNPGDAGLPAERYAQVRTEIMDKLLSFKDTEDGMPVVTKIATREEAFPGKCMEQAPDLTLTLRDGGFVSIFDSDTFVKPRPEIKGTHRPEGIFIAGGDAIARGTKLDELSILDVAPTLLYSLGLPIPENLEGQLVASAFEAEYISANPARAEGPTQDPDDEFDAAADKMAEADQDVVLERLRALGYMQ